MNTEPANLEKLDYFVQLYVAAHVVGLLSILLVFYWCVAFAGGFGLSGGPLFQWHPLFMSIGIIYLMGNGILMFRVFRNKHKFTLKLMHAATNAVGLVFVLLAALAVLINHNQTGIPNYYSMHSWVGLLTVSLYVLQAIVSILAFLLNAVSNPIKAILLPFHVYFGHVIFVLGIAAAISGINEKAIFKLGDNYSKFVSEGVLLNSLGILFILFGTIVVYISTNIHYKRYPHPEDNQLLERSTVSQ